MANKGKGWSDGALVDYRQFRKEHGPRSNLGPVDEQGARGRAWFAVRATSLTPTASGLYPGKAVAFDETIGRWREEADVWIRASFMPPKTTAKFPAEMIGFAGGRPVLLACPAIAILGRLHRKRDKGADNGTPTGVYSYAWYPDGGSSAALTGVYGRWTAVKTQTADGVSLPEKWQIVCVTPDTVGGEVRFRLVGFGTWSAPIPFGASAATMQTALNALGISVTVTTPSLPTVYVVTHNDFFTHEAIEVDSTHALPPANGDAEEVNGRDVPLDTWVFLFSDHVDGVANVATSKTQDGNGTSLPATWSIVKENITAGGWRFKFDTVATAFLYHDSTAAAVKAAIDAVATGGVTVTVTGSGTSGSPWIVTASGVADHTLEVDTSVPSNYLSNGAKYKFEHVPPLVAGSISEDLGLGGDLKAITEGDSIGVVYCGQYKPGIGIDGTANPPSAGIFYQFLNIGGLSPTIWWNSADWDFSGLAWARVLPDATGLAKVGVGTPPPEHRVNYEVRLQNSNNPHGILEWFKSASIPPYEPAFNAGFPPIAVCVSGSTAFVGNNDLGAKWVVSPEPVGGEVYLFGSFNHGQSAGWFEMPDVAAMIATALDTATFGGGTF